MGQLTFVLMFGDLLGFIFAFVINLDERDVIQMYRPTRGPPGVELLGRLAENARDSV